MKHSIPKPARLGYSPKEASEVTGLSRSMIYVLLKEKALDSVRIKGRRIIPRTAIDKLLGGQQ
ncbi:MAG: helix-turn-helix domain-containing protein [Holophagaceae bacterium]|nr:helix-turn-helix domain-containing protein [Holophagaceae bacterium]